MHLLLGALLGLAQLAPPPADLRLGFESIEPGYAREIEGVLAGPALEGRGTGQVGYTRAAAYVAGKFAEFGLQPAGDDGSFFQEIGARKTTVDAAASKLVGPEGFELRLGEGLGVRSVRDSIHAEGPVVFVNLVRGGEAIPVEKTEGRIVVVRSSDPRAWRGVARMKAAALLVVSDEQPEPYEGFSVGEQRRPAMLTLTTSAAAGLAKAVGVELPPADATESMAVTSESRAKLDIQAQSQPMHLPNVAALLKGSDPELSNETIILGSHLDHLGVQGDQTYWGADDDASGSTALIMVARALARNPVKPKRSILFLAFAAEEAGLLGSSYDVAHPLRPLDTTRAMLQMDMVGRSEENANETAAENAKVIHPVGAKRYPKFLEVLQDANRHVGFEFEFDEEGIFGQSDHAAFAAAGIPAILLYDGDHPDYHRPSDTPDKIEYGKIVMAAQLAYLAAHSLGATSELVER